MWGRAFWYYRPVELEIFSIEHSHMCIRRTERIRNPLGIGLSAQCTQYVIWLVTKPLGRRSFGVYDNFARHNESSSVQWITLKQSEVDPVDVTIYHKDARQKRETLAIIGGSKLKEEASAWDRKEKKADFNVLYNFFIELEGFRRTWIDCLEDTSSGECHGRLRATAMCENHYPSVSSFDAFYPNPP